MKGPRISQPSSSRAGSGSGRICRFLHTSFAILVLFVAGSNLIVWLVRLDHGPLILMRCNAALALTLGGASLWLWRERQPSTLRRTLAIGGGILAALIGGLTSLEYLTGWNLHIDELIRAQGNDAAAVFVSNPGRMSLNAAITIFLAGLGLALLEFRVRVGRRSVSFAPALAIVGALPLLAAFVGYAIGLGRFTGILGSTNILLHTALTELALCGGIVLARPERQPLRMFLADDASGVLLRWVGPAAVALFLGVGWFVERGERVHAYDAHDALAVAIFLGLAVLAALLSVAALVLRATDERRMRADAAVREQEERFHVLAENISQLAWMTDAAGKVVWYNKRWFEYTGTTLEDMRSEHWKQVHHPDHIGRVVDHFRRAIADSSAWEDTFPLRSASGEWRWFLSRALPRKDEAGQVVGWFGTNTDITEQRDAAEALSAAKEAAEHANNAKDEFLAALSHELRTPLTPVLMAAEEMCDDRSLPDEVRERLRMMRRNVRLESRLIDDLLDLTRITRGRLGLRTEPCDLQSTLHDAIDIVRDDAAARSLTLRDEIDPAAAWIMGDRTRLAQVFWNLLRNAVKFTASGGEVVVRTRRDAAQHWTLEVSDTGIGIATDVLPTLFNKFEQGEWRNDHRFGGLGLGLAISKAIVDLHGGQIVAESAGAGRGATFTVCLGPLIIPPQAASTSLAPGQELRGLRLLLVEDHPPTAAVMARLLGRGGHTVISADSVAGGLAAAEAAAANGGLDAVICDLGLPDGSGHDLMMQLRERHGLRGIAVSGYGMEEDVRRSQEAGFSAHLTKPIEYSELRDALRYLF